MPLISSAVFGRISNMYVSGLRREELVTKKGKIKMSKLEYQHVLPVYKEAAARAFELGPPSEIIACLLGAAYHEHDWRWVQDKCLFFLSNSNQDVRQTAVVCLEHLARIHGVLDEEIVVSALAPLKNDPIIGGQVEDTLEGIAWWLHRIDI
jgi:hypothetical protein